MSMEVRHKRHFGALLSLTHYCTLIFAPCISEHSTDNKIMVICCYDSKQMLIMNVRVKYVKYLEEVLKLSYYSAHTRWCPMGANFCNKDGVNVTPLYSSLFSFLFSIKKIVNTCI